MMNWNRKILTSAVVLILLGVQSVLAGDLDCARVLNQTEGLLCKYPDIRRMDEKMTDLYEKVNNVSGVEEEQEEWITQRNSECGQSERCLRSLYRQRMYELEKLVRNHHDYTAARPARLARESRPARENKETRESRAPRESRTSRDSRPIRE